jgi:3-dehydroquinate synthetase
LGLAHGEAVAQGTFFALDWGLERGILPLREHARAERLLEVAFGFSRLSRARGLGLPSLPMARKFLGQDKKRAARDEVIFIFLERFGRTRREAVGIEELLAYARRAGWIRR